MFNFLKSNKYCKTEEYIKYINRLKLIFNLFKTILKLYLCINVQFYLRQNIYDTFQNWPCPCGPVMEEGCPFKGLRVRLTAFWHRLPSKTNLFRRCIISSEAQLCVTSCGFRESENRLFFVLSSVWSYLAASSKLALRVFSESI